MYRNVVYSFIDKTITLFTWDAEGNRIKEETPFSPYFFIEDTHGKDGISIFNTRLKKISCENTKKRNMLCESFPRNFYNIQPEQQFLIDKYLNKNIDESFFKNSLKIYTLDIEVYSPNEFPDALKADHPITLISVHDSILNVVYSFGLGNEYFTPEGKNDNVIYNSYPDERALLKAFLRFWRKDFPDVITGWNIDNFDIPYICNRIIKLSGDPKVVHKFSPTGYTYKKEKSNKRAGSKEIFYEQLWTFSGITSLDYFHLYQVFSAENHESYSLESIASYHLDEGKTKHDAVSLSNLQKTDWNTFVDYNIQDVNLVVKLEKKLRYLQRCKYIAYKGLSPIISAASTVNVVTGFAAQEALKRGKYISTFGASDIGEYTGGFVKSPQIGLIKSLLYYDANSLYPNTIITLNTSPETKLGKIIKKKDGEVTLLLTNGNKHILKEDKFKEFCTVHKVAISSNNVLFSQKEVGIFPTIVNYFYNRRVEIKKELKGIVTKQSKLEKGSVEYRSLQYKIDQLDDEQYAVKILINRVYGYFGQRFSPMYDIDIASSITHTGQQCIKTAATLIEDHIKTKYNLNYDPIVMSDTDSVCFSIEPILKKIDKPFLINDKVSPVVYEIANDFKSIIDFGINKWVKENCNSLNPTYEFKRENISYAGLFLKKKHYILNIRDEDDIQKDKIKPKGVQMVRVSTPKKVKPIILNIITKTIKGADLTLIQTIIDQAYQDYKKMELDDIATTIGLNNYNKYYSLSKFENNNFVFNPHTPRQVRAAIIFNHFIDKFGLSHKYEKLKEGDKIKTFYLLPNKYNVETMAFNGSFPDELKNEFMVDVKKMFNTSVYAAIEKIFVAIEYKISNPLKEEKCNLLNEFCFE